MITETSFIQIFGLLGGLFVLAFFANQQSQRTRVPDVIILMITGLVLGPIAGWIKADQFATFTQYLGTFALILILFQAGSELHVRDAVHHFPGAVLFGFLTYGLSVTAITYIGLWVLKLPLHQALLLGAAFGCTSSTLVVPVLQQFDVRGAVSVILILEAALGDIVSVISVGSLIDIPQGNTVVSGLLTGFVFETSIAVILGVIAGLSWSHARSRFAAHRFYGALHIGGVLLVYALVEVVGGSGLLAVLAFGLTLANVPNGANETDVEGVLIFHSDLSFLVRSFFFVLLGASVEFIGQPYLVATGLILVGLFLARMISIYTTGWVLPGIGEPEKKLILGLFPRGLVNAVLSIQIAARQPGMAFLPAMAFTVILVTSLLMVVGVFSFRPRSPG